MNNKSRQLMGEFVVDVVRSRRKTLSLEVTNQGIKARAPLRMSEQDISLFVQQKSTWLKRHLATLPPILEPFTLVTGTRLPLLGAEIELQISPHSRGRAQLYNTTLLLPIVDSKPTASKLKTKLTTWYKAQAQCHFTSLCEELGDQMGVAQERRKDIRVRDYKRRWGSCDAKGGISFNWRLIMAPPEIARYVAVHELAHCHEFNHSPAFWRIVESVEPDWRDRRDWLYRNSTQLYRI